MDILGLLAAPQPRESPLRVRVETTLDAIVVAVQRVAAELRPSILDDLGLIAALESDARLFEERTGIECVARRAADAAAAAGGPPSFPDQPFAGSR